MARTVVFAFFGLAAFLLGVATAILILVLAISLISGHQEAFALPLVAAIVQIVSCCTLATLILLRTQHDKHPAVFVGQTRRRYVLVLVLGILPSLAAAAVVGSALGWGEGSLTKKNLLVVGAQVSSFLTIIFVVWGMTILAQSIYYVSFAWVRKTKPTISSPRLAIEEAPQQMIEPSRPATVASTQSNPFREQVVSSPPSLINSDGTISMRSSFSTLQRPPSSKKGYIIREKSYNRRSERSSYDGPSSRPSQDEGFDSWDTSAVSSQIRETVFTSKPLKGSGLEPIPGSRSPSPAKALEGPFFQPSPSLSPPPSPLPQPSISRQNSPTSSPIDIPNYTSMFPPSTPPVTSPSQLQRNFSRPGSHPGPMPPLLRSGSRSRASSVNEGHIHPLFRSSGPTPPPSASANTKVTAAPGAGLLINERTLKRMRSGSLPSSPSPLIRSLSFSDIRNPIVPPSPSVDTVPTHHTVGRAPSQRHQKKRSLSLESSILK
ncbi:hypothetical protein ABVK25_007174 [Lepraria finkii]|uniref:Uncharacterized protein n=1 Tax=Lepraria finkii TaxID=1340010 RepID=A0ABR4B440_9LECA